MGGGREIERVYVHLDWYIRKITIGDENAASCTHHKKGLPIKDIVFSKQPIDLAVISSYEENKIIGRLFSLWEQTDPGFWSFKILHTFPESILFLGG